MLADMGQITEGQSGAALPHQPHQPHQPSTAQSLPAAQSRSSAQPPSTPSQAAPLARSTLTQYAAGSLGTGGFGTLPGLVLVYFLTDSLGVTAALAGLVVIVAKVWDVIIDPIIGNLSDRSLAHSGSRARFMLLGAIFLPIFFFATFALPPALEGVVAAVWVLVAFLASATAFSLFQVPYIALPAELTSSYDERTRLLTWRVVVLTVAILLFGGGGPMLRSLGGDSERLGYALMALVAGVVLGVGFFIAARVAPRGTPQPGALPPRESAMSQYRAGVRLLRNSRAFRTLLGTFFLQAIATGLMLAGAQYVAKWVLDSESAVTLLFVALIAPALIMAPVWGKIARRVGKERSFMWASIVFAVGALSMLLLAVSPGVWVYAPVAVCGAAYAGMQSLPMAMLPDVIAHETTPDTAQAGVYGGVWTAGETTGMALGSTALTAVLALTGYLESTDEALVTQPDSAVLGIVVAFSVIPAVATLVSLFTLRAYPLRRADLAALPEAPAPVQAPQDLPASPAQ